MILLGVIVGFLLGAVTLGWTGGLAGGFVGFIAMLAWRSRGQAKAQAQARASGSSLGPIVPPLPAAGAKMSAADASAPDVLRRLAAIEQRLGMLERAAGFAPAVTPRGDAALSPGAPALPYAAAASEPRPSTMAAAAPMASRGEAPLAEPSPAVDALPQGFARASDGTLAPVAPDGVAAPPPSSAFPDGPASRGAPAGAPNPLWAWFTGGNALTRIGVIALFFGVAFLLKYLAEIITVPIELKLVGVALAGAALVVLGGRLARGRPGYGLSLEGAGAGILYLTTFAAFRLYDVLPAFPAFALLVAVAALTVWLALRADSQPLAGLAIAGGFLAPFLVSTDSGSPALLFGYFLVLNTAIFALAWVRAWRALNALGFVFTFALGIFWGDRYYQPAHFATVEPFLAVFFLFYVTIAVLYAKRESFAAKAPVDALLVFGVPLVAFALQAALVHDTRYGVAWSAVTARVVLRRARRGALPTR